MKAVLALAASLSVASASSLLPRQLDQLPQCALSCALGSLQSTGCTNTADIACICSAAAFVSSLIPCVQAGCSAAEIDTTIQAATALCAGAGVSLSIPPIPTETGASSSPASSEPASTSEAASTEAEATTTAPQETTAATTAAETSEASTTEAPATTVPGNVTETTGTRPPTPTGTEPGAASRNTIALGGLGAIVALVAAFL